MTKRTTTQKLVVATATAAAAMMVFAGSASALPWGITSWDGGSYKATPNVVTPDTANQAGEHPAFAFTKFSRLGGSFGEDDEKLKDVFVDVPPGFVGNLEAVEACPVTQAERKCPLDSQVGVVRLSTNGWSAVHRIETPRGVLAAFRFHTAGIPIHATAELRTGDDYGLRVSSRDAPTNISDGSIKFAFWGVPADSIWDPIRGSDCIAEQSALTQPGEWPKPVVTPGCPASLPERKPFLTLPTSCVGPLETFLQIDSWLGSSDTASFTSHDNSDQPLGVEGCDEVPFSPTLEARPTTNVADSPSGLDVNLHIPQNEDPDGIASAHLRDSVVSLPEGMTVNPASANGLGACSEAQFGFTGMEGDVVHTTAEAATCPDDAKLGTVQVDTPALDHPVTGAVYLAAPHANPFGSLLALYIALHDPETGIVAKLAGRVQSDPVTGQLTATFKENPQLPFENLKLRFFGGPGGSLRTPATCGDYTTASSLTPWSAPASGPPATPSDSWSIEQAPGEGTCPTSESGLPHSPSFDAGTISPIAGAHSPMVINLRREDGSQQFSALELSPPPGLVGKLAGIPYCSEAALREAAAKPGRAEEAGSSCPGDSYLGSVVAAAGAGPAPYYAHGKAYLTGPYKGAPLSVAILTPATAGPFDLGTIVVRSALYVNPKTAQISAISDPIPSILQGIPLDVRSIQVKLDRPDFTLNPTSCDAMSFDGSLRTTLGHSTSLSNRFQVGECGRLGFKPRIALRLFGGVQRGKYQGLRAVVRPRPGDANIGRTVVRMPRSAFLAQEHIRTVCTRVQFAADACPKGSIYGRAIARSPLLDYALRGNVYLRSSDNTLPDLVADLRGPAHQPIRVELVGRTDSVKGALRNTFDVVPDAPVSYFRLQLFGGKKGLIVNSRNICRGTHKAAVGMSAQNGRRALLRPVLFNRKCKQIRKRVKRKAAKRHAAKRRGAKGRGHSR